jgi:hypothetical protein
MWQVYALLVADINRERQREEDRRKLSFRRPERAEPPRPKARRRGFSRI